MSTKISYCNETWNPVTGCTKHSPGCANCYAAALAQRLKGRFGYDKHGPFEITFHPEQITKPFRWKSKKIIFVCSMGDIFHHLVPNGWINLVINVMRKAPHHDYLVLTKRASRMNKFFTDYVKLNGSVPENLWIGVSAEDQKRADERLPLLLETPAAHRFLSIEPLLEHVNLSLWNDTNMIDWVITGGESGRQARFMEADWARAIRDQCKQYAIPFYMKQMSRKAEIPVDLEIQQLPVGL